MAQQLTPHPLLAIPNVTLEGWPEASAFSVSYADISVHSLVLRNQNKRQLAVDSAASGALLRPKRFLVPGESELSLTLALPPAFTLERGAKGSLTLRTALLQASSREMDDLDSLFDQADSEKIKADLKETKLSFSCIIPKEEKASHQQVNGVLTSRLLFQDDLEVACGYLTAYIFLHCSSDKPCTAWCLTPSSPFWYSLTNSGAPGEIEVGDAHAQYDSYAFGYLSPGQTHLTYLDLKVYKLSDGGGKVRRGRNSSQQQMEYFKAGEQTFLLHTWPLERDPRVSPEGPGTTTPLFSPLMAPFRRQADVSRLLDGQAIILTTNLQEILEKSENRVPRKPYSEHKTPTFIFNGPYTAPESASIRIRNPDKTHTLVYRVLAQDPSFFSFKKDSLGVFHTISPKREAPFTVELINLQAHFSAHLDAKWNANGLLFRLDTFLLPKRDVPKDDYLAVMMQAMDTRQMETTIIRCLFHDQEALETVTQRLKAPEDPVSVYMTPSVALYGVKSGRHSPRGRSRSPGTRSPGSRSPASRSPGSRSPGATRPRSAARNRLSRYHPRATGNATPREMAVLICFLIGNGALLGLLNGVISFLE